MKLRFSLLIILAVFLSTVPSSLRADETNVRRAYELLQHALCVGTADKDDLFNIYSGIGLAHSKPRDRDEACGGFRKALEVYPNNRFVREQYRQIRKWPEAALKPLWSAIPGFPLTILGQKGILFAKVTEKIVETCCKKYDDLRDVGIERNSMKVDVEKARIYYEEIGGGTPILMLHGYTLDHRSMKACMEPLFEPERRFKRIYFDLPGMGNTELKEPIRSTDEMFENVTEFIHNTIAEQPFAVAGLSYGAYLAQGLLHKMQERILAALFICPVVFPSYVDREVPEFQVLKQDRELLEELPADEREDFLSVAVIQTKQVWDRYREEITEAAKLADEKMLTHIQEKHYGFSFDLDVPFRPFCGPVQIITGRQDHIVGYKDSFQLTEKYPRAGYAVIEGAGHILQIEQTALFNAVAGSWIDRIDDLNSTASSV